METHLSFKDGEGVKVSAVDAAGGERVGLSGLLVRHTPMLSVIARVCALRAYESVRRLPREASPQSYLFEPPAELTELESACVRDVRNTNGVLYLCANSGSREAVVNGVIQTFTPTRS